MGADTFGALLLQDRPVLPNGFGESHAERIRGDAVSNGSFRYARNRRLERW